MPTPATISDFLGLVRKSGLLDEQGLNQLADLDLPEEPFACAEALVKAHVLTPFQAKQLLAGRYRGLVLGAYKILRPLGKGGMGVVYLADHASLGRKVAIKVLTQDQAKEHLGLERFYREARAAAALDHPNIVRLHDITQISGIHFLVMEYVDGLDLQSLIQQTGALHHVQAANYIAQAAAGLQHAHERGFIHRDVKPANLILAKDGTVKILDMGLARSLVNPKDELTGKLDDDVITGTADYLSPEQALNVALDHRSDIYSLGATFYTLVSARPPFNGSTAQKLAQHQVAPPPNLGKLRTAVPPELNAVVTKMMAKKPADRFQNLDDVIDALSPWLPMHGAGAAAGRAPSTASMQRADTGRATKKAKKKKAKEPEPNAFVKFIRTRNGKITAGSVGFLLFVGLLYAAFGGGSKKSPDTTQNTSPPVNSNTTKSPGTPGNSNAGNANTGTRNSAPIFVPQVVYRLDLSDTKPFVQSHKGRTIDNPTPPAGAPVGWGTHSWQEECEHAFVAEQRDGRMALGMRLLTGLASGGRPEAMLYAGGIDVVPNRDYVLQFQYQTSSRFTPADLRMRSGSLRVLGKMNETNGEWRAASYKIKTGNSDKLQLEFHHYGPLGIENGLFIRDVELIDPEARATGPGTVARLDAGQVPAFRLVRGSDSTIEGAHGKLPAGWVCEVWNKDATGEFRSESFDGRSALRVCAASGTNAAQFVFRPFDVPNTTISPNLSYRLKIDYQADPGVEGYVHVQKRADYSFIDRSVLKNQGSGWYSATIPVKPDGKEFQIAFGCTRTAPGKFLSISRIELIAEGAESSERLIYTFDLSKLQPFKFKYQDGQPTDPDWRSKVPNGVYLHCWKRESVAEFRADVADGRSSIGVANFNDENSSQILFQFDEGLNLPLQAGASYRVRMEYRTQNDAEGRVDVRNPKNNDFSSIATNKLEGTDGKWRTVELTFRRPADGRIDVCIINGSVGEGNILSVRSLEVFDMGR